MKPEQILKIAKECGFIPHTHEDGECYADIESLQAFAKALQQCGDGEAVAEFKQFGKSGLQGSYCQFVFNPKFVKNCKEGDKVYAIPPDQTAKIKELQDKVKFQDEWLSKGVYFTTEEYVKECADFTRQNEKIAKLQKQNDVMKSALVTISSQTQDVSLLWWQQIARTALDTVKGE